MKGRYAGTQYVVKRTFWSRKLLDKNINEVQSVRKK